MYLNELKSDSQVGVATVLYDFTKKYSFILQDEAQEFHLNNTHATLHTEHCGQVVTLLGDPGFKSRPRD
jgi:hypothetical protein